MFNENMREIPFQPWKVEEHSDWWEDLRENVFNVFVPLLKIAAWTWALIIAICFIISPFAFVARIIYCEFYQIN